LGNYNLSNFLASTHVVALQVFPIDQLCLQQ